MKLNRIKFSNYKAFKEEQDFEIKPITIVIGKNNSGKSALCRLPLLLSNSFSIDSEEPLDIDHDRIDFGGNFRELIHGYNAVGSIGLEMEFQLNVNEKIIIQAKIQYDNPNNPQYISEYTVKSKEEAFSLNWEAHNSYTDKKGNKNKIRFKGLLPNSDDINDEKLKSIIKKIQTKSKSIQTKYLGPIRIKPERVYKANYKTIFTDDVSGKSVPHLLYSDLLKNEGTLLKQVSEWYKENFNWELGIEKLIRESNTMNETLAFQLILKNPENPNIKINLVDTGQGITQVLPMITFLYANEIKHTLWVLEQPELHLHPAAHGNISDLLMDSFKNNNNRFIIETHSENLILRIRRRIAEGTFSHKDVIVYWVDDSTYSKNVRPITFDNDGEIENFWPEGIFSESFYEMAQIDKANKGKRK